MNRRVIKVFLLFFLMAGRTFILCGQYELTILDKKSGQPVSFAHVCLESLDKSILENAAADSKGKVSFKVSKPVQLAVSALGYVTLIDTLQPGKSMNLYLQPTRFSMDEVVVTAQYSPRRADRSIYPVQVFNSRQIQQKGANNLTELLSSELNIRVGNDAALGSVMSIQGLSGEHVKILVDGVPVIGRMNGNIDLNQINMHNVDHVELVEGPMSVIYGSNALAGVVNIITKEDYRYRGSAWQNTYLESAGVYNFDLGGAFNRGKHAFSVSGLRNFFSGYSEHDSARTRQWKPRLQYMLDGYYLYRTRKLHLKFDLRFFDETIMNKGPLMEPYRERAIDSWFYTRRWTQKVSADYSAGPGRKLNLIAANSNYSRRKNTYLNDLTVLEKQLIPDNSQHDTTGFGALLFRGIYTDERLAAGLACQVGIDINTENGQGRRIADNRQSIQDYAAFASIRYEPVSEISLQSGLRYGYNTKYRSPLVPSLNIKWEPVSSTILRASYARGFRAPSLKELYLYFVDINHNIRGNAGLKAEYSHNVNVSAVYRLTGRDIHRHSLQGRLFYNSINDRISLLSDSTQVYSYMNIDWYKTFGGMINYSYSLHPRFNFETGLYRVGRKSILTPGTGYTFSTDFSSKATYQWLSKRVFFTVHYKYNGRLPQYYSDGEGNIGEGFISAFHMMDASVSKSFRNDLLILGIGAKNLFDYNNIEASGISTGAHSGGSGSYPVGWGRSFFINLKFQLGKY